MQHVGEQELLQRIRDADYAAFEELHRRYYRSLYTHAAKKIGDEDEAYNLVQEMFIELWDKRATFSITNSLPNYLKNRLWFKLSGYFRDKGFQQKHFRHFSDFLQQDSATTPYLDPMEIREMESQYEALIEVIDRTIAEMPEKMRKVFVLSRSNGYSISQIAEELDISPKTVKNQLNIAFNRIRNVTADSSLTAFEITVLIWLTIN
ncbi:sigma-70 family RNA polymerase sigma factor [Mucilaginibacter defluvii]|uniref:RNA polymerase sigma-70 factor n=1 Tax=Mucilaginibacter defluvii TaxID=1196019 RepID=A0ABP9FPF7_9SPHI|nr:sigma-70 family RNA polymerase sigma factor [Bacteroidota bacterium]